MIAVNWPRRKLTSTPSRATTLVSPVPYTLVSPAAATAASGGACEVLVIGIVDSFRELERWSPRR
jgi:hypothetical protein